MAAPSLAATCSQRAHSSRPLAPATRARCSGRGGAPNAARRRGGVSGRQESAAGRPVAGRSVKVALSATAADAKAEALAKQLSTATKAFCSCTNEYGAEANAHVCPVCLGHRVVAKAVAAGVSLGCKIAPRSKFDRKQYFYADLPKGYQISQYDEPICSGGSLVIQLQSQKEPKTIGITRATLRRTPASCKLCCCMRQCNSWCGV
eukprot:jgi/Tetstr1/456120/TSEL_042889.t1